MHFDSTVLVVLDVLGSPTQGRITMAVLPKEAALLLSIDAGLHIFLTEQEQMIIDSLRSGGYIEYARENLRDVCVVGPRGALRLTTLGQESMQTIKNELAQMGVLDINESRLRPRAPRDVSSSAARITKS